MNPRELDPPTAVPRPASRAAWALAVSGLLAVIIAAHAQALGLGWFMDDWAHVRQLREADWSLAGLTAACRLELVGGVIDLWWLPEHTLRFFRPVSFGLMKLAYTLLGWNPQLMHAVSLAWHAATCLLLMMLLRRCGASLRLAWGIAALFALHPAHVATVQWIAAQTELMVTTFLLASILCFARFRGWWIDADSGAPRASDWLAAAGCATFFALALGCRENALLLPLVLAAGEARAPRARRRGAIALYAVLLALAGGYLALRTHLLGGAALPPRPYVVPPGAADFWPYVLDKTCYYLIGEFLAAPCVPIGGLAYLRQHPAAFYGLTGVIVIVVVVACWRYRRARAAWLAPAALLGFMAPVLPVFESPHHLYLPGIGWALAMLLIVRAAQGAQQVDARAARGLRAGCVAGAGGLALIALATATYFFGVALATAQRVEARVIDEVASARPALRSGETLYIANLPMIAHYVRLGVEERLGIRDLRVVALTWSPRLLGVMTPSELVRIDDRTFEIAVADDRFFSGPEARLIREAWGGRLELSRGAEVRRDDFTLSVRDADAAGVARLRVTFAHAPGVGRRLFWGSQTRWACQVAP